MDVSGIPGSDVRRGWRRRRADRWRPIAVAGVILACLSILLSAWLYARSVDARRQIAAEGNERRDQTCRLFEGQHLAVVVRLRRTYMYLERLPREEYGTNLTRAIVRQLPDLENEARVDLAPSFCDAEGVGLREPDPTVPPRQDFSHLLQRP